MERRTFERIPVNIDVKFFCYDTDYSGTVTNLSENGMFITTNKMCFPFDSKFEVIIHLEGEVLCLPVKVSRITKSSEYFDGIGVQIVEPVPEYIEFLRKLRSSTPH